MPLAPLSWAQFPLAIAGRGLRRRLLGDRRATVEAIRTLIRLLVATYAAYPLFAGSLIYSASTKPGGVRWGYVAFGCIAVIVAVVRLVQLRFVTRETNDLIARLGAFDS